MFQKTDIMLSGRSRDAISGVLGLIEGQRQIALKVRVIGNGHDKLWQEREPLPDVLVICVEENWRDSLPVILNRLPANKPPFLVLCPASDIELLRTAMRAGARDVLAPPYEAEDLVTRLVELAREGKLEGQVGTSRLAAFINAKGGSGASFLASNVAAVLSGRESQKTLLMDLDFQFGSLSSYLNMSAENGLVKALEFVDSLDTAALAGYTRIHANGLHLLAGTPDGLILPDDIAEERITKLLEVLDTAYQNIIIDLPRRVDRTTAVILERADQVFVITQQTVAHLQDTKRLMMILRDYFGISGDQVRIVLNRFSKKAEVRSDDFISALPGVSMASIPSDYLRVAESINLGIPVVEGAARSHLGKAILTLSEEVLSKEKDQVARGKGLLGWFGIQTKH